MKTRATGRCGGSTKRRGLALVLAALMMPTLSLLAPSALADSATVVSATLPTGRHQTSAVWDGTNAYVFGGYGSAPLDQIVRYNPSTNAVTVMSAVLPTARFGTSAVWDGTNAYIFGGADNTAFLNQIVRYNPTSNAVTVMSAALPGARRGTSAVWDGTNAYIFGGFGDGNPGQIVRYNPATDTVTTMSAVLPTARFGTSAVWDGTNAYVFGGLDNNHGQGNILLSQIVRYNPSSNTVAIMSATLPTGREGTSAAWDGSNAYVFGGDDPNTNVLLSQIVRYNPPGNSATVMSAALPTARTDTSSVWAGSYGYVFGGVGASELDQIVRYSPLLNHPPVAVIAPVADAECTDGGQTVSLDGSGSSDPDGDAITYAWSAPGVTFGDATSARPSAWFPLGSTVVTLVVTDPSGATGMATATVRVVDTLPPTVSIARPVPGAAYVVDKEVVHGVTQLPIVALGPLTVAADAQDQCGIAQVSFASSTGATGSDPTAPYTFVSDPAPTASGSVRVTATAHDLGGHAANAGVTFVQVGTAI